IGLVGQNGCGKSTMLKLLSKIMYPDEGSIEIKGRVSSLIELGAGFHPDMSGRENIYTNAAIFGLTRAEIDERLDTIIEFAELGDFIDSPVRIYSSGMYMRLAFSVAVNVDADVLLVDEILAVGDAGFQVKCFNKLQEIKRKGTTIVIVSHSLGAVEQFCDRSYWICDGLIREVGTPRQVHPMYLQYMAEKSTSAATVEQRSSEERVNCSEMPDEVLAESSGENTEAEPVVTGEKQRELPDGHFGTQKASIDRVVILDKNDKVCTNLQSGESYSILIDYTFYSEVAEAFCGIGIHRVDGVHCYGTNTEIDRIPWKHEKSGKVRIYLNELSLLSGEYTLDVAITEKGGFDCDYFRNALKFDVFNVVGDIGLCRLNHRWECSGVEIQKKKNSGKG
ncbi:MAG: ABC transporter ATP-binding protein, partial [Oscillospiraceae bacterium]|nr:ABC transporter ATP-binding protein [Oscillospiraceae bacterium]